MAMVGLKRPIFVPITADNSGGVPTYGTGIIVGKAIEANVSIELSDGKLYADDAVAETDKSFVGGSITMGVDDIDIDAYAAWFGAQVQTVNGVVEVTDAAGLIAPLGGFGYVGIRKKNGVRTIRSYFYYKTQWGVPSDEFKTRGESTEFQTPSVEGDIMTLGDEKATWRKWAQFTTEADAFAWLYELCNIGEPANKTALNAAITSAQALDPEDYTSASWVDAANALADAVAVAAMESPSQMRVDNATSLLTTAIGLLVERE